MTIKAILWFHYQSRRLKITTTIFYSVHFSRLNGNKWEGNNGNMTYMGDRQFKTFQKKQLDKYLIDMAFYKAFTK